MLYPDYELLAPRLFLVRSMRRMSMFDMEKVTGISRVQLQNYEMAKHLPTYKTFMQLAQGLEVSTDYLCGMSNDFSPVGKRKTVSDFAERVRQARVEQGLSQSQLARMMKVSQTHVSRWEQGAIPSLSLLRRMSDKLDVTVDWLCGFEEAA